MSNDLSSTYLSTLNKDELIQLVLTMNNKTVKDKREIIQEAINNVSHLSDPRYPWIRLCSTESCMSMVNCDGGIINYGFTCEHCDKIFCLNCNKHLQCYNCGACYCYACNDKITFFDGDKHLCNKCYKWK